MSIRASRFTQIQLVDGVLYLRVSERMGAERNHLTFFYHEYRTRALHQIDRNFIA